MALFPIDGDGRKRPQQLNRMATQKAPLPAFARVRAHKLLKDEATEEKGERARMASFVGAMAIADLVKTTLGPKGMDKILQSTGRGHSVTVTNDGATILKSLHIDNPAAKVLVACYGVSLINYALMRNSEVDLIEDCNDYFKFQDFVSRQGAFLPSWGLLMLVMKTADLLNFQRNFFADAGILAIEHADFDGIERLALVTGGGRLHQSFDTYRQSLYVLYYFNCNHVSLEKLEVTVNDSRVLLGGVVARDGLMAKAVDELAKKTPGKRSHAIEAFSQGISAISNNHRLTMLVWTVLNLLLNSVAEHQKEGSTAGI
nr:T-complex protein 1 subunit beta [Ipomoea batatas]